MLIKVKYAKYIIYRRKNPPLYTFLFTFRIGRDSQVDLVSNVSVNIIQGTIRECILPYVKSQKCFTLFRDCTYANTIWHLLYLVKNNPSLHYTRVRGLSIL